MKLIAIINFFIGTVELMIFHFTSFNSCVGDVVLKNLVLKQSALSELDLPVQTIYGQLGSLVLKIPWKNLYSAPVEAYVDRLYLLAVPNSSVKFNAEKEENAALEAKKTELERIQLAKKIEQEKSKLIICIFTGTFVLLFFCCFTLKKQYIAATQ